MGDIFKIIKNPLFWIFLLALFLRTYKLGEFPYGFHVDEVKVAWNALSILKTGYDDHGSSLSLYYNSFGDYRPTGIFYITIPSIIVFGRNEFATRFPTALFGALSVIPIYFLIELLDKSKRLNIWKLNTGHLGGLLMAISPWSIDLSRATNEVVASTFFALCSLFFFLKLLRSKNTRDAIFSIITIIFSYLLYHPIRFLGPPIFVIAFLIYMKQIKSKNIRVWSWICMITVFLLTLFFSTTKEGLARFDQVSIFKDVDTIYQIQRIKSEDLNVNILTLAFDNKFVTYIQTFMDQYGGYFAGDFLIGSEARPYRFATPGVGLITYIEVVLLIAGIVEVVRGKKSFLPLVLLLIAPLPAAVTTEDAPNLSRAFLMLPFLILLEAYGLEFIVTVSKKYKSQIIFITFSLLTLNFLYFSYMYLNHATTHRPFLKDFFVDSPTYRDVGAKELSLQLDSLGQKYSKVIITNFPDNPYPWYAFFTGKDPAVFNNTFSSKTNEKDYGNLDFSEERCPSDDDLIKYKDQNILMIDSWVCPYQNQIDDGLPLKIDSKITRPDGSEVYILLERDWAKPLIVNGVLIK